MYIILKHQLFHRLSKKWNFKYVSKIYTSQQRGMMFKFFFEKQWVIKGPSIKTLECDDENNKMDQFFYSDMCF